MARPAASKGIANVCVFTTKLLCLINIVASERPPDGEAEGGTLLKEWRKLAELGDGVDEGRLVGEIASVHHDRRLEGLLCAPRMSCPGEAGRPDPPRADTRAV